MSKNLPGYDGLSTWYSEPDAVTRCTGCDDEQCMDEFLIVDGAPYCPSCVLQWRGLFQCSNCLDYFPAYEMAVCAEDKLCRRCYAAELED